MPTDQRTSDLSSSPSDQSRPASRGVTTLLLAPLIVLPCLLFLLWLNRGVRLHLLTSTERVTTDGLGLYHGLWLLSLTVLSLMSAWFASTSSILRPTFRSEAIKRAAITFSLVLVFSCAPFCAWLAMITEPDMALLVPVPGYQIMLVQGYTDDAEFAYLRLKVTRSDGKRYMTTVEEGVTLPCASLATVQHDAHIYLQCNDEPISAQTMYVDSKRGVLYIGHHQGSFEQPFDALPFEAP